MHGILQRLWALPWPAWLRRHADLVLSVRWLQALYVPHYHVGVVGIIWNEEGRVLLLRHTYRTQSPWGLPTGFLEHGEQPAEALTREIREEAGLDVQLRSVWRVYSDPVRPLLNIVFQGRARSGVFVPNLEISAMQFFSLNELPQLIPDQEGLIRAAAHEQGGSPSLD